MNIKCNVIVDAWLGQILVKLSCPSVCDTGMKKND